ncbi:hypothetical protein GGI35DRAFT_10541 [Trichoderma velutinum]
MGGMTGECPSGAEEPRQQVNSQAARQTCSGNRVDGLEWIRKRNPGAPGGGKMGQRDLSLAPSGDSETRIGLTAILNPVRSVSGDDVICIRLVLLLLCLVFCNAMLSCLVVLKTRQTRGTTSSRLADQRSKSHAVIGQPVHESMTLAFGRRPRLSCLNCTLPCDSRPPLGRCRWPRVAAVRSLQPIRVQDPNRKGGARRHASENRVVTWSKRAKDGLLGYLVGVGQSVSCLVIRTFGTSGVRSPPPQAKAYVSL